MRNTILLESIWQGEVAIAKDGVYAEISRLLELMLPLNTVCLSARSGVNHSRAVSEEDELLPSVSLGDALTEELSATIPYGSLVVLVKENAIDVSETNVSFELGVLIGDLLLDLIGKGAFPLQHESEALLILANSYCRMIVSAEFKAQRLCVKTFTEGLALSLGEYWSDDIRGKLISCDQSNPETVGGVRTRNCVRDAEVRAPKRHHAEKCIDLMRDCHKKYNHNDWAKNTINVVMKEIHASTERVYNH